METASSIAAPDHPDHYRNWDFPRKAAGSRQQPRLAVGSLCWGQGGSGRKAPGAARSSAANSSEHDRRPWAEVSLITWKEEEPSARKKFAGPGRAGAPRKV